MQDPPSQTVMEVGDSGSEADYTNGSMNSGSLRESHIAATLVAYQAYVFAVHAEIGLPRVNRLRRK